MADTNWIKLNRKIWENFIWDFKNPKFGLAWIDMLLMANYMDKKILFDGAIETVERGSFITSMVKLADRWDMDRKTVKRLLDLLQQDGMIVYTCTRRRTSIKIVKYDTYQNYLDSDDSSGDQNSVPNGAENGAAEGTTDGASETIENTGFAGFDAPTDGQLNGHQMDNSMDINGTTDGQLNGHNIRILKNIKESKEGKESKESYIGDSSDGKRPSPSPSVPYETIQNLYNEICRSFPRCTVMSDARKKAVKARMSSGYTLEHFKTVFTKAEASSFLKGQNDRNWKASFDWLTKDANMAKVLDGNYDAKGYRQPTKQPEQNFPSGGNVFLDILKGGEFE